MSYFSEPIKKQMPRTNAALKKFAEALEEERKLKPVLIVLTDREGRMFFTTPEKLTNHNKAQICLAVEEWGKYHDV